MNETFQCGDAAALMDYLYDEASAEARRAVTTHLAQCRACEAEVATLTNTRAQLVSWRPPEAGQGFRVARLEREAPPVRAWWQNPMPAWMQAAAAAVVFAAGLAVGSSRPGGGGSEASPSETSARTRQGATETQATQAQVDAAGVTPGQETGRSTATQSDVATMDARLRSDVIASRPDAAPTTPTDTTRRDDDVVLRRVRALIQESEARQQRELALRTAQVMRDFEIQRRLDMASVQQSIGQVEGVAGAEFRQQREMWNQLMNRVGQPGAVR
jgi:anti-sigma factor RsiW